MMYAIMAFDVLGYAKDHPLRADAVKQFEKLDGRRRARILLPAMLSPVWTRAFSPLPWARAGVAPEPVIAPLCRLAANQKKSAARRLEHQAS